MTAISPKLYRRTNQNGRHELQFIKMQNCIYKITCLITNKFYIGSAINWKRRQREHRVRLSRNEHHNPKLQRAWNKYGEESFTFEILEIVESSLKLIEREQYWIDKTKCCDPEIGYNFCTIGRNNLGVKRSEETKKKMSVSNKKASVWSADRRIRHGIALTGRRYSSKSKGKPWSENRRNAQFTVTSPPIIIERKRK